MSARSTLSMRVAPPRTVRARTTVSAVALRPSLTALAVHVALAGWLLAAVQTEAVAQQTATSEAGATRAYDIPAGPLDAVLTRFITESGIPLATTPQLVQGRRSPGVRGTYSAPAALEELLTGTGLQFVRQPSGGYSLHALQARPSSSGAPDRDAAAGTLAAVTVTAAADRSGATEGTGSYAARSTSTATKLALSPRETPQTMTVVTRQQMDDFGLTTVEQALESTSGVYVQKTTHAGANYFSRGFNLQTQYDGVNNPLGIGSLTNGSTPDSAFLDHIEVLQGANGLLTGAGNPGGVVNLIRKNPTREFQASAEAEIGSWNKRRLVGDISGALVSSGVIRGRLVAVSDDSDSFIDYIYDNRKALYGIVEADLTDSTKVSASIQFQKNNARRSWGVPTAADGSWIKFPRSSYFGGSGDFFNNTDKLYTVSLEQNLPKNWMLKTSYSRREISTNMNMKYFTGGPLNSITGQGLSMYHYQGENEQYSNSIDFYASGPVGFLGRKHDLMFGANGQRNGAPGAMAAFGAVAGSAPNVYSFNPEQYPFSERLLTKSVATLQTQKGIFGAARLNLRDDLKLILGSRLSWYEYQRNGVTTMKESKVATPYAGIVFDLNKNYSLYASYTDIFNPQSVKGTDGDILPPVEGSNYEVGIKGELFNRQLNVGAALFRLEQTNLSQSDPTTPTSSICGGSCYVAQGKIVSKGIDLNASGNIFPDWNLYAGLTFSNSEYAEGVNKGMPNNTVAPKWALRLASMHRIPNTGWTIGGNLRIQSETSASGIANKVAYTIRQGGFALVGLSAKYDFNKNTNLTINVSNIFDKKYLTVNTPLTNIYGNPRNLSLVFRHQF